MAAHDIHRTINAVWRMESAKIIGGVARLVRDVGLAEELAQDTLLRRARALAGTGVPDNPGAWLMAAAKNRALDHFRRNRLLRTQARADSVTSSSSRSNCRSPASMRPSTMTSATTCCG